MKKGQKPAFPNSVREDSNIVEGMSTRLYIAIEAMKAIIGASTITVNIADPLEPIPDPKIIKLLAYQYADAMLEEEE